MGDDGPPTTSSTPAGWYPHPAGGPHELWWDGERWTEHTRPTDTAVLPPPPAPALRCLVCGNGQFQTANYMLNTQGLTLLDLDGFNKTAICQVCTTCGFIHWFATR